MTQKAAKQKLIMEKLVGSKKNIVRSMLKLFRNGEMSESQPCESLAESRGSILHFGTNWRGRHRWEGRIDEVAIFDKALSHQQIDSLMLLGDPSQQ